jgi:hypothetical protein
MRVIVLMSTGCVPAALISASRYLSVVMTAMGPRNTSFLTHLSQSGEDGLTPRRACEGS